MTTPPSPDSSVPLAITRDIPGIGGVLKQQPSDFFVDELPLYETSGQGEHLYLFIEKRELTTTEVVHRIARAFKVSKSAVSYAGLKDKQAITRQHLSVHLPGKSEDQAQSLAILDSPQVKVLWADRHANKLRRGHLAGNRFIIRIREVDPIGVLSAKRVLERLGKTGVPNYFGPQRFGYRGDNAVLGRLLLQQQFQPFLDLLLGAARPVDSEQTAKGRSAYDTGDFAGALDAYPRSMHPERQALDALRQGKDARSAAMAISPMQRDFFANALQSAIFNSVLSQRIEHAFFDRLIPGDLAWKHDSRSIFAVDADIAQTENGPEGRVGKLEVSPSGPMWGGTMMKPQGEALALEHEALAEHGVNGEELISSPLATLEGARRPIRVGITNTAVAAGVDERGGFVQVSFDLPRGSYATVVLAEIMKKPVSIQEQEE